MARLSMLGLTHAPHDAGAQRAPIMRILDHAPLPVRARAWT